MKSIGDLDKLDMAHKNAARVVTEATARCDTSTLMNDVAWPMLASRRRIHRLTMFYQIVNGLSPPYLRDLLPARVGSVQDIICVQDKISQFLYAEQTHILNLSSHIR